MGSGSRVYADKFSCMVPEILTLGLSRSRREIRGLGSSLGLLGKHVGELFLPKLEDKDGPESTGFRQTDLGRGTG